MNYFCIASERNNFLYKQLNSSEPELGMVLDRGEPVLETVDTVPNVEFF
jgi:hypothetical protein